MEKMIYFLQRPAAGPMDDFRTTLLGPVIADLREQGVSNITLNIAEFNDVLREQAPGRLMGPWQDISAIVSGHFRTLEDFTDDSRYFGSKEAVEEMMAHIPGFCDLGNMVSLGMSEYHFD